MVTEPQKTAFQQTEVGEIPSDWEVKDLLHIADIDTDNLSGSTTPDYVFQYISIEDVEHGILRGKTKLLFKNAPSRARRKLKNGDILVSTVRPNLKSHLLINQDVEDWICSTGFSVIRCKSYLSDSGYVFSHFFSFIINKQIENLISGSNYPAISSQDVKKLKIPTPPTLTEQTAIATALTDADALITQLSTLIAKKKAMKQGAMQELLKPKAGWEVKRLGEVGNCIIGLTYSPSNVRDAGRLVLRSSNIQGNKLAYHDNVFVNVDVPDKIVTQEGDILICVRNGSKSLIGKCAYISGRGVGETFGAFMSLFRSPYNEYVFYVLQSYVVQRQIEETIGATINQLTNKNLNSFEIPFPDKFEQTRIAQILSDMDAGIEKLEQQLAKQKRLKQGMMQVLLTGKIRLV